MNTKSNLKHAVNGMLRNMCLDESSFPHLFSIVMRIGGV